MPVIVFLAAAWCGGVALGAQLNQPAWLWLVFSALAGLSLLLLRDQRLARLPLACAVMLGLGAARLAASQPADGAALDPQNVQAYVDTGALTLEGVVWDEPIVRETGTQLRLRVHRLRPSGSRRWLDVRGLVLVNAPRYASDRLLAVGEADFHFGDTLRLNGPLETPPTLDGFSYRDYLARSGITTSMSRPRVTFLKAGQGPALRQALFDFKAVAVAEVARLFPQPQAALLAGILLGNDNGLPDDLRQDFNVTGTAHIIAISGFNVAILAGLVTVLTFRLMGRSRGSLAAVAIIFGYALLVGASGSVLRAAIMGSLTLFARNIGRRGSGPGVLAAAVIAMTLWNPLWLWDIGFQLSVAATLGLALYVGPLEAWVQRLVERLGHAPRARRVASLSSEILLMTSAAQLTTFPLTLLYFQRVSVVSLLANALILPAQPAVMLSGGGALALGLLWQPLGEIAARLAWPFAAYTTALVQAFARLPGAAFYPGAVTPAIAFSCYVLIFGLTWLANRRTQPQPAAPPRAAPSNNWVPAGGLVLLGSAAFLTWSWYFSFPARDGRLRVTVLDVALPNHAGGAGEAILIQPAGGASVLIDGGVGGKTLASALTERLPLFTTDLDLLVIASPREESLGALPELLSRYHVKQALVTGALGRSAAYTTLVRRLHEQGVPIVDAGSLPQFDLGSGETLRVVADGPLGTTLRLEWDHFAFLLPIGLDADGESDLVTSGLAQPATAVLVADHGAASANSAAWLRAVNPQVAVISVSGPGPAPDVLARLDGCNLLRTDENGTLTLETDGERLWVEAER